VLSFIGFIILTWFAAGFLALVFDWIEGFPKAVGDRSAIKRCMKTLEKYKVEQPKTVIFAFAVAVFVLSGPFSFFMPELEYDFED
jgi:membrane-bound acyltransferase YfiQ involved in biofilm formation